MTADLLKRCKKPFESALKDAGLAAKDINEVVLVGGATRMPMVQELVRSLINKEPNKGVNPDEVVAIGAAIQAGVSKRYCERCSAPRCDSFNPWIGNPGRCHDSAH